MIKDVIMRWGQDWGAHPGCPEVLVLYLKPPMSGKVSAEVLCTGASDTAT